MSLNIPSKNFPNGFIYPTSLIGIHSVEWTGSTLNKQSIKHKNYFETAEVIALVTLQVIITLHALYLTACFENVRENFENKGHEILHLCKNWYKTFYC